ncbi:hypothetical protein [uncultured Winogradskyella sp.]|uniref:hypothetical protein n=1 Tax=uncultured Winogradskyella sp. TaxID=395353 RepID=UPI003518A59F
MSGTTILIITALIVFPLLAMLSRETKDLGSEIKKSRKQRKLNPYQNKGSLSNTLQSTAKLSSKFLSDSTTKYRSKLKNAIDKHYLTSFSWVRLDNNGNEVITTFMDNNKLLFTQRGNVVKCNYELIGQNNSILIEMDGQITHFEFYIVDNNFFLLNKMGTDEVLAFANRNLFSDSRKASILNEIRRFKQKLNN